LLGVVALASIIEANNNLPSWDSLAGCAAAVHGVNSVGLQAMNPEGKSRGKIGKSMVFMRQKKNPGENLQDFQGN
jgi:hypothetical protein